MKTLLNLDMVFRLSRTRQRGEFISGQIYAVGGLVSNGESVSTVEIYDPHEKGRRMGGQMSMMRSRVCVAVIDGKLYAFGGFNGSERLSTVEIYDPRKNIWTQGSAMNCKRKKRKEGAISVSRRCCGCKWLFTTTGHKDGNQYHQQIMRANCDTGIII
uniref:Kelch repeat protein n=1 Tax=Glossina morsitans morsitans TaxID=37546 RepID=A0A1B0G6U5_GLOMM